MPRSLIWLMLLVLPAQLAADDSAWATQGGKFLVNYDSELNPLVINRIHRWTLAITDAHGAPVEGATIIVDGCMPEHDHGLPTAPRVTHEIAPGRYVLEGLRFHMAGAWEIVVTIDANGVSDSAVIALEL